MTKTTKPESDSELSANIRPTLKTRSPADAVPKGLAQVERMKAKKLQKEEDKHIPSYLTVVERVREKMNETMKGHYDEQD